MAFKDWTLPTMNTGRKKLEVDQIAIVYNSVKGPCFITLNSFISQTIKQMGYLYLNIKQDDITGEIGIEINNERGINLSNVDEPTLHAQSKEWIGKLGKVLGVDDGKRKILRISKNLSTSDRCMFFRIINKFGS